MSTFWTKVSENNLLHISVNLNLFLYVDKQKGQIPFYQIMKFEEPLTQIFNVIRTNFLWIYLKSLLKWSGHTLLEGCLKISMCVYLQIDNSRDPSNKNNLVVTLGKWQRKPDLRTIALQKNTSTPSVALFMWLFSKHHML